MKKKLYITIALFILIFNCSTRVMSQSTNSGPASANLSATGLEYLGWDGTGTNPPAGASLTGSP